MQRQNLPVIINDSRRSKLLCNVSTYKKQVDKLKLVEGASQFCFKNEHREHLEQK